MVHQNAPDHLGRDAIKVRAAFPVNVALVYQAHERFVHQRRTLQRMVGALPPEIGRRQSAEFPIDKRHESFDRLLVAIAPVNEKLGDITLGLGAHRPHFISALTDS